MKVPSRAGILGPGRREIPAELRRPCLKCGARRGWRCMRLIGSSWVPMKTVHRERLLIIEDDTET